MRARYADIAIRWKLLAPFALLMVVWGGFGSYVLARGAASEARARLTATLVSSLESTREGIAAAERRALETVRLASHTEGMDAALARASVGELKRLLLPIAVNADVVRLDIVDRTGTILVGFDTSTETPRTIDDGSYDLTAVLSAAKGRSDRHGDKWATVAGDSLVVAGPVRDAGARARGAIVATSSLTDLIGGLSSSVGAAVVLFDDAGGRLAGALDIAFRDPGDGLRASVDGYEVVYAPLEVRGVTVGTLAVALDRDVALAGASGTARTLAIMVGLAVLAVLAIGAFTARAITHPLGRLLAATRSLESGDLGARAAVEGRDEVGTLASSFNAMAAELQASHEQLEAKVAERTTELARANRELARVSDAKSRFLASMSHELRTPLNAIIGFADMLGDPTFGPVRARETRELAGNILTSGQHLLTLINDVLDLAKVEAGKIDIEPAPFDAATVIGEVLSVVRPLADQKRQTLTIAGSMDVPRAFADQGRTRQILFNLVANAIKYTPDRGAITVGVRPRGRDVEVWVSDTGPGLTKAEAARLFEPFERGKASPRTEGAGLGLALAKHLVELQGGTIRAEGTPGSGSTFSFSLPTEQAEVRAKVAVDA